MRSGAQTTEHKPNLIPFDEDRRIVGCICMYSLNISYSFICVQLSFFLFPSGHEDSHHINYLLLYKGLTSRCKCGQWFKLVDFNEYEAARDRYWKKIENEPENQLLMKQLNDAEAELGRLLDASKDMTDSSPGSTEMLDKLSIQWEKYKQAYHLIREKIDHACMTDIR